MLSNWHLSLLPQQPCLFLSLPTPAESLSLNASSLLVSDEQERLLCPSAPLSPGLSFPVHELPFLFLQRAQTFRPPLVPDLSTNPFNVSSVKESNAFL